ncbi:type VI secretion system baseplate subunit TssG, partial [Xanthomonas oryzae]
MLTAKRRIDPGIALQLLAEPHRFQFFQAMRILERVFQRQGVKAGQALPTRVRFHNSLSLAFPATELDPVGQAYSQDGERLESDAALAFAIETESLGEVHLTPNFMGLLGTSGALPLHYTETLHERELYQRDRTPRAFLDMFSNRAVALHYAAWKKHRLALQYELDRRERFLPLVLSLLGMGMPGLRDRMVDGGGDVFDQAVAYYA